MASWSGPLLITEEHTTVEPSRLLVFGAHVLAAAGIRTDEAEVIASYLVEANLRGVDGHGVLRLLQYAESVRRDQINTRPYVTVARRGSTALVDADGGYGYGPSVLAMQVAIEIATELGTGAVGVKNSHHFGMATFYALQAAEAGYVGITISNTTAVMPAPGGLTPVVGNDPIAVAVPTGDAEPLVVDLALSVVSWGKISLAASRDEPIPLGWAYDRHGVETTNAQEALAANLLVPIGGAKGFALAAVLELVAGALTGSPVGPDADGHGHKSGGCGHLMIALDPERFGGHDLFLRRVAELAEAIQTSATISGESPRMPGSRGAATKASRIANGIPLSPDLRLKLNQLAASLGAAPL